MAYPRTALECRSASTFELPPSKRQCCTFDAQAFALSRCDTARGSRSDGRTAMEDNHGGDSCTQDPCAPGTHSPSQMRRLEVTTVSSYAAGALSPSPAAARENSSFSSSSSASAGAPHYSRQNAHRELHRAAAIASLALSSACGTNLDLQAAASVPLPSAPAPMSSSPVWRHAQPGVCGPRALVASPLAARPCLEGPEEWIARLHPALGLSSPDTLRLALHTWRRVQVPVTTLVHMRTRALTATCYATHHQHHHSLSTASAGAQLLPLPAAAAAAAAAAASSSSSGCGYAAGSSPAGRCGGGSPAPYAPAAAAASAGPAAAAALGWPADLLAISRRLRTERAFAAACVRLAAKVQERREVTRTLTEPLAAASGTNGRIILNAEVCVMRWVEWNLLDGFVPEDAHLICGVGWEM